MAGSIQAKIEDQRLKEAVLETARLVRRAGGRALLVGGAVRDAALGRPVRDVDIEVYGIPPERLEKILSRRFSLDRVGKSFGVLKLRGFPIDVSLPRREWKLGTGHRGFLVQSEPFISYEEAASRRDFTINSMAWDPLTSELLDPYGGLEDLQNRILRHTSPKFVEDPLRVLRGMQFAARFDLTAAPETIELCKRITMEDLPRERVFEEWKKLILFGVRPSRGLQFLADCTWIRYYPELEALRGCRQEPSWHPEGDVWVHTLHCMDAFAGERIGEAWEDLVVGFAVLCHDFGKPATTKVVEGRIRSLGHEEAGAQPTRSFLGRMTNSEDFIEQVVVLVTHHLRPQQLYEARAGDSAIRRLARRVGRIDRLVRVARADQLGRPGMPFDGFPAGKWLLERAQELAVKDSAPKPIVLGRHLIALGLKPGPHFKPILDACYEAQLDGRITNLQEGIAFAKSLIDSGSVPAPRRERCTGRKEGPEGGSPESSRP